MDDSTLDTLLRRSAPATGTATDHPAVEAAALALVADAEVRARPARRVRRALWIAAIPTVPLLAFGLTAGLEARLAPDLTIPVAYTTDTGTDVSCSIFVFNGEIAWAEQSFTAVDHLSDQDWTGIGQRIYARALVEEQDLTRRAQAGDLSVSLDGTTMPDAATIERMAWSIAETDLVDKTVPAQDGDHWGGDTDCSGQLH